MPGAHRNLRDGNEVVVSSLRSVWVLAPLEHATTDRTTLPTSAMASSLHDDCDPQNLKTGGMHPSTPVITYPLPRAGSMKKAMITWNGGRDDACASSSSARVWRASWWGMLHSSLFLKHLNFQKKRVSARLSSSVKERKCQWELSHLTRRNGNKKERKRTETKSCRRVELTT
jgi:hypothetical protein